MPKSKADEARTPTRAAVERIVKAFGNLVRTLDETGCVEGTEPPPGLPGVRAGAEIIYAMQAAEHARNPGGAAWGDAERDNLDVDGWPDVFRLARVLGVLYANHDALLETLGLQALCSWKWIEPSGRGRVRVLAPGQPGVVKRTDRADGTAADGWPPGIEAERVEAMRAAVAQLDEMLADVKPDADDEDATPDDAPGEPADDGPREPARDVIDELVEKAGKEHVNLGELAKVLDVSPRTIARWRKNTEVKKRYPELGRKIADADKVVGARIELRKALKTFRDLGYIA